MSIRCPALCPPGPVAVAQWMGSPTPPVIEEDMPLNSAVYEPGRDKIFAVRGGYVFQLNASTGVREASNRYICPDDGDNYITYDSVSDKLYATSWMTFSGGDFPGQKRKYLVQIDPDTLAATPYGPTLFYDAASVDGFTFVEGPREVLVIGGKVYGTYVNKEQTFDILLWEFDPSGPTISFSGGSVNYQNCPLASFAYDPDSGAIWVPNYGTGVSPFMVPGITTGTDLTLNSGNSAAKGLCYRSGFLYATLYNLGGLFSYQIRKIKIADNTETTIDLTRPDANPVHIRYNAVNDLIYVPCWADNTVVVIDPTDDSIQEVVSGFDSPWDVVFTGSKAFAVQHGLVGLKEIILS